MHNLKQRQSENKPTVLIPKKWRYEVFAQQQQSVFQPLISPQIQIDNLAPFSNYSNRAECILQCNPLKNQVVPVKKTKHPLLRPNKHSNGLETCCG